MLSSKEMSGQVPDTDVKSQSSRHIPCAVHLESWQKFDCERLGGAYLHLFSDLVRAILAFSIHFGELKNLKKTVKQVADRVGDNQRFTA